MSKGILLSQEGISQSSEGDTIGKGTIQKWGGWVDVEPNLGPWGNMPPLSIPLISIVMQFALRPIGRSSESRNKFGKAQECLISQLPNARPPMYRLAT